MMEYNDEFRSKEINLMTTHLMNSIIDYYHNDLKDKEKDIKELITINSVCNLVAQYIYNANIIKSKDVAYEDMCKAIKYYMEIKELENLNLENQRAE